LQTEKNKFLEELVTQELKLTLDWIFLEVADYWGQPFYKVYAKFIYIFMHIERKICAAFMHFMYIDAGFMHCLCNLHLVFYGFM
jgi:hypothetical protein